MSWSNREQHRAIRTRKQAEARIPEKPILDGADQPDLVDERPERTLWAWAVATMVGVGFWRPGSGTWASAITALAWWAAGHYLVPVNSQWIVAAVLVWVLLIAGIPASGIVARECGQEDPSHVVIDEVAGQMIALIGVPLRWQSVILSFILFRAFDIVKPPPLRRLEKIEGGAGIVLDDVGAGVYAVIIVHALVRLGILK
jgi:phosphatidylglycerophosphatase A